MTGAGIDKGPEKDTLGFLKVPIEQVGIYQQQIIKTLREYGGKFSSQFSEPDVGQAVLQIVIEKYQTE